MTASFEDGSVATLTYTALGTRAYPKEHMELFCDGKVFTLENYTSLKVLGSSSNDLETKTDQKGHHEELETLADCIQENGTWPIPLWQQIQAMEMAFQIEEQI